MCLAVRVQQLGETRLIIYEDPSIIIFLQVPPEMDRHLGFLEIPQPRDQRVEVTLVALFE